MDKSPNTWQAFKTWSHKINWVPFLVILIAYDLILAITLSDAFMMGATVFAIGVLVFSRYSDARVVYMNYQSAFLAEAVRMMKDAVGFYVVENKKAYQICEVEGKDGAKIRGIHCKTCGMVSFHPDNIKNKYCGNCKRFHDEAI